jgi:hypothetical protein
VRLSTLITILLLVSCGGKKQQPPAPADASPPDGAVAAAPLRLKERPGGPTRAACERAADHLREVVVESLEDVTNEQRAYAEKFVKEGRDGVIYHCLEMAVPKEIDCVTAAKDLLTLAQCERFRREMGDIAIKTELTEPDCERFFDRMRQLRLADGVSPEEIDAGRDQAIRTCLEKGKPGTVACMMGQTTWAAAKTCP